MHPPGSRPGIKSFAIIPAISPKTIHPIVYSSRRLRTFGRFVVLLADCTLLFRL
jgi:hypothetical protein